MPKESEKRVIELKTWPTYFSDVRNGTKTFEVRKDDRGFKVGAVLVLREWSPKTGKYTGEEERREVSYILDGGQFGIENDYVALGFKLPLANKKEGNATLLEKVKRLPIYYHHEKRINGVSLEAVVAIIEQAEEGEG